MIEETILPMKTRRLYKLAAQTGYGIAEKTDIHRIYFGPKNKEDINQKNKVVKIHCGQVTEDYRHSDFVNDILNNMTLVKSFVSQAAAE